MRAIRFATSWCGFAAYVGSELICVHVLKSGESPGITFRLAHLIAFSAWSFLFACRIDSWDDRRFYPPSGRGPVDPPSAEGEDYARPSLLAGERSSPMGGVGFGRGRRRRAPDGPAPIRAR